MGEKWISQRPSKEITEMEVMLSSGIVPLIKKTFSLDSRSLALFRVSVSVILILDFLFVRLPYFTLFYSDEGILPLREVTYFLGYGTSSLNLVSPLFGYQFALFILALIFFLMLFVGYQTKWALLGTWALLVSFNSRNYLILNSGDILLHLMLFWSLYLPLNQNFSIDSALGEKKTKVVFSLNSIFFIFQILFVYFFAYLLKTHEIWKTGQAIYYALMLDSMRTVWGDVLLQYEHIMQKLSYITYYFIECSVPFLFILFGFWWKFRIIIICIMCGFHLSAGLFLHLGCFSWICMAGWLAFLPGEFWEKMGTFLPGLKKTLNVYYDDNCSLCRKSIVLIKTFLILPDLKLKRPFYPKLFRVVLSLFFTFCFIYVFMWNLRSTDFEYYKKYMSRKWNGIGYFLHFDQYWNMFAPRPSSKTGWIMLSAIKSHKGLLTIVDLWQGGKPLVEERPARYDETFPVFRLRKMLENFVSRRKNKKYSENYLRYLCDKWNKKNEYDIKSIKLIYMEQRVPPQGDPLPYPKKTVIGKVSCKIKNESKSKNQKKENRNNKGLPINKS